MELKQIKNLLDTVAQDRDVEQRFKSLTINAINMKENQFHPLVYVGGEPDFGTNVYVGLFSEINAQGGTLKIGDNCDIASFVSINVADSHKKTIGKADNIERGIILLEESVFVGSHCFIGGTVTIGHHSVVAAGTILSGRGLIVPPYSLVIGNPAVVKPGYYLTQ
jgi:acetyltransferase-like isoleucine patch superfamily enzyme